MRRSYFLISLLILIIGGGFSSCRLTSSVPDGRHLLIDNEINIDNKKIDKEDLQVIIKQKPNRKILGLWRFHLHVYNLVDNGKTGKFWEYWRNTIGEKPVLLDSALTDRSTRQLKLYFLKEGYFEASVTDTTKLKKKKARVEYNIQTGLAYYLRNISRSIPDPALRQIIDLDSTNTLLKPGIRYDEDVLGAERDRITDLIRNSGYYYFTKDYLYYDVDTNISGRYVDIKLNLTLPGNDSLDRQMHQKYYLDKIYVITDYEPGVVKTYKDTLHYGGLTFLYNGELPIKPSVIGQHVFLERGDLYQQRNSNQTYRKLNDLRVYRSVNIVFREPSLQLEGNKVLNSFIYLSPLTKQYFDIETQGTSRSGGILGIEGNLYYTRRNTFKGAELLEFRLKGGLEAQKFDEEAIQDEDQRLFFFNTAEIGPEISLTLPRFLLPVKPEKFSKYFTPKTTITAGYNYQSRPELSRKIMNFRYGFNWREFDTKRHEINVIETNLVKIEPKEDFAEFLDRIDNPFIERTYTNHFTFGSNYTFTYNNRKSHNSYRGHYFFFRGILDLGGNTLYLANKLLGTEKVDGSYQILGVPFSQFTKVDMDLRFYRIFHEKHNVATRIAFGVGAPYLNQLVLPLEKSYFIGGANSIRAWAARTLGPGSFNPGPSEANTLRIGDVNLEGNVEYRFDLFKIVEGAWFVDAGNIWLLNEDKERPGSQFHPRNFYRQIAIGSGVGIRLDFSFFIFRFDLGLKVRDPMQAYDENWVITRIFDQQWKEDYQNTYNGRRYQFTNWNLGIGYPF